MLLYFHVYKQSIIRGKEGIEIPRLSRVGPENWRGSKIVRGHFPFDLLRLVCNKPCCSVPTQAVGYVFQKWITHFCLIVIRAFFLA